MKESRKSILAVVFVILQSFLVLSVSSSILLAQEDVLPAEPMPEENRIPTALLVFPSYFSAVSGESLALSFLLMDDAGNPIAGKRITLSPPSAGTLYPLEELTNERGVLNAIYSAPEVTQAEEVFISAYFEGDELYLYSRGGACGIVYPSRQVGASIIVLSPERFELVSGEKLRFEAHLYMDGEPLAGKELFWDASLGTILPWRTLTDEKGTAAVTYEAPHVDAPRIVSIVVKFVGDNYPPARAEIQGIVFPRGISTVLEGSPPSFTLYSGESIRLKFGLFDEERRPLGGKLIHLYTETGRLEPMEVLTREEGTVEVVYTAPIVTEPTKVVVHARFGGDGEYLVSEGAIVGGILPKGIPAPPGPSPTFLLAFPTTFTHSSGEPLLLLFFLLDENGNPLAGKPMGFETSAGELMPSEGVTDRRGSFTVTYIPPQLTEKTRVKIVAFFGGDETYAGASASVEGIIVPVELAGPTLRIQNDLKEVVGLPEMEGLEVIDNLVGVLPSKVGAVISIREAVPPETPSFKRPEIAVITEVKKDCLEVRVDSTVPEGRTVVVNLDNVTLLRLGLVEIKVLVDNVEAKLADDYADVLDPTDDGGLCEYLVLLGGKGAQVLVSIPHFSTRTITIRGPLAVAGPWTPLMIAIGILVTVVILLFTFHRYRRAH
ncbi:MAG: Ig-like domain-containing protein [Candidatus Hadarchaeales archaeon]